MDGRYLTVSTHGAPLASAADNYNFVTCSVCDTNLNTEDFCGHSRGRVYEDDNGNEQLCFWKVGALDYKEVSIVNNPADNDGDIAAQIINFAMLDGESPEIKEEDKVESHSILIFSDNEVSYADEKFLEEDAENLIANLVLWESVGKDKQKYIENKGLLYTDGQQHRSRE